MVEMLMDSEHSSQYSDSGLAGLDLSQVSRQAKRRNNQYKALSLSFRHGCQCVHKIFTVLVVRVWHSALGQSGTEFESPLAGILDRVLNLTGNRLGVPACWQCAVRNTRHLPVTCAKLERAGWTKVNLSESLQYVIIIF